jgi:hypothetical protein
MKFLDISGYGHSGKGVLTDLFREFYGYNVPHPNFEFNLLRIQGGLLDLKFSLVDNWSPIRSNAAILRYKKLVKRIGPKADLFRPKSLFYSNGMSYDLYFNQKFTDLSIKYINSLISYTYEGDWPYNLIDELPVKQFIQRFEQNIFGWANYKSKIIVTSVNKNDFILLTQNYLNSLFNEIKKPDETTFVMHNAFEPFHPQNSIEIFENAKSIIVQRDPRDIYASLFLDNEGHYVSNETSDHWKQKISFLGAENIDIFCNRQLIQFQQALIEPNPNILRIRYEDIILKYDQTLNEIYDFLGEEPSIHIKKKMFFNPENSKKNIGLWKKVNRYKEIQIIEKKLSDFLYN